MPRVVSLGGRAGNLRDSCESRATASGRRANVHVPCPTRPRSPSCPTRGSAAMRSGIGRTRRVGLGERTLFTSLLLSSDEKSSACPDARHTVECSSRMCLATVAFPALAPASASVLLNVIAVSDLGSSNEFVTVKLNGAVVVTLFTFAGNDCPTTPDVGTLLFQRRSLIRQSRSALSKSMSRHLGP